MWFDSHCHLQICAESVPLDEVVARARSAGVDSMVTVGIDIESSRQALRAASADGVWASVGLHPNTASQWSAAAESELDDLASDNHVVGIGESGLDFYRDHAPRDAQLDAFRGHIRMAKKHGKALIIHTRASVAEAIDLLEDTGAPASLVFHCWSGTSADLHRALRLGAYISFAGNVSFKSAGDLRERAAEVPVDRLLVETDSPYLTPMPFRGTPNEPRHVSLVGEAVAAARAEPVEAVAAIASENARSLFGLTS